MTRLLALATALLFVGAPLAQAQTKPPADPFVYRSAQHGTIKIVRAVVQGRLYLLLFVHKNGVWFLAAAQPAASLPSRASGA